MTVQEQTRVGLHAGMPADEYHAAPGASQSRLKVLRDKSPAHLKWEMDHPSPSSPAQKIGAAIHDAVLLPDLFVQKWVRAPEVDRRTKAGKAAWAEMEDANPRAEILRPDDYDTVTGVRDAVMAHTQARRLLDGDKEQSAWWEDPESGVLCKGRFDVVGPHATMVDLKTTRDASPQAFGRDLYNLGYYLQAAHYLSGARELGLDVGYFIFIAVEKAPPFGVALYRISDDATEMGREELQPLIRWYAQCERLGSWPCYPDEIQSITLPAWSWGQISERVAA